MRISIGDLLAGRRAAQRVAFCEHLEPPAEDVFLIRPVEGELLLTRAGRDAALTGRLHTVLGLLCGACLARFEQPLDFPVAEDFGRASAAAGEPSRIAAELDAEDFVVKVGPDEHRSHRDRPPAPDLGAADLAPVSRGVSRPLPGVRRGPECGPLCLPASIGWVRQARRRRPANRRE